VHCLQAGWSGITQHMIQPHKSGDYHAHADREQVYYFTAGQHDPLPALSSFAWW